MQKKIWIFAEHRDGRVRDPFFETLYLARMLGAEQGGEISAVLLGHGIGPLATVLSSCGATNVFVCDRPEFGVYSTEVYASALAEMVCRLSPSLMLFPATWMGMDLSPRVAAELNVPLASRCVEIALDSRGEFVFIRRDKYGGSEKHIAPKSGNTVVASLIPTVYPKYEPEPSAPAAVVPVEVAPVENSSRIKILVSEKDTKPGLDDADIVVSGGRGLGSKERLAQLEDLAGVLGAALGVSRPLIDAKWKSIDHLVGISGRTIAPRLYFAFGISGAVQHVMGMHQSQFVVAINKDRNAPIMKIADLGIIADLEELLPLVLEEIGKKQLNQVSKAASE